MRIPRTLSWYVLREALQYAGIGLFAVGSVLLTQNLLQRLDDLSAIGASGGDILAVTACLAIMLGSYAIPVALLFGVLVAVGRLSSDSEVMAMRALGVSLAQLVVPFLLLGVAVSVFTAVLLRDVEPGARRQLRAVMSEIAARGGIVQPGVFSRLDREGKRLIFVEERSPGGELEGVLISDRTNPAQRFTVAAATGRFVFDEATETAHLELERGDLHFEPEDPGDADYQRIAFDTFDYAFDMSGVIGAGFHRLRPAEYTMQEIDLALDYFAEHGEPPPIIRDKKRWRYEIQRQRRLALPFAPALFALVGVPLGLRRVKGARSTGALLCVALVFGYYALLSLGVYLAETRVTSAAFSLWIPNLVFGVLAVGLLARARRAET
jgi:lipopolysaccharide export system permease protein